eukprot:gene11282-15134_t
MSLRGKISLITGSTSGIGLGIAHSLAKQGSNIILNGFGSSESINTLVNSISDQYKVEVSYADADLAHSDQINSMMDKIERSFGGVNILVNNAGIQHVEPVDSFSDHKWKSIIDINLSAVFYTSKRVIPMMKKQNWGRIINIASVHGLVASAEKSAYVAAKHGVIGLTKVIALENARSGITCNAICPGWVLTPLVEKQIEDRSLAGNITFQEAKTKLLMEKQPSGEFVTPSQLGDLSVFLASDAASEVRGVAWAMDGGWTAQ